MKFNFKKVSAIATSALMVGMTAGIAAAANYPAPFVDSSGADVAVVLGSGSGVSVLDSIQGSNILSNLQSRATTPSSGTSTSLSGEVVSLDTSSTRIWLNRSLNSAKSQLTKTDLPTVLQDYTFSGSSTSKLTSTIKLQAGAAAGGDNSGKVIFAKQPESNQGPVIGISLGTGASSNPLYNASVTMSAVNFTHADSEGEEIEMFGQSFTIASDTDTTKIVLLKEAEKLNLDSDNPSATVTVGGATYTVELVSSSDTSAVVRITDSAGVSNQKEINEASSKRVSGVDIAVTTADETNLKLSASIIVGANKLTLQNGAVVTVGEDDDPIDGTIAYIVGGTGATTELAISVFRPDSTSDAILEGESFVDPVFGSFKFDFAGLSTPLDSTARSTIEVVPAGDKDMEITFAADGADEKTFNFAHNESNLWSLGDSSNYSINVKEMANLSYGTAKAKYTVVGNEDYGHILELYDVYNQTTGTNAITNDRVKFRDHLTGDVYETTFTSTEGSGTIDVDGKRYTVTFVGTGEDAYVSLKYPSSEDDGSHSAGDIVLFPTIQTTGGALVAFYDDVLVNLGEVDNAGTDATKILFPDGDGYTSVAITYLNGANWSIGGTGIDTLANYTTKTVGKLTYNFTSSTANNTRIRLINPEDATTNINNPSVIVIEGKDDATEYHAIVVDLEDAPAGTSNDGVGVQDLLFSSTTHWEATKADDSDITEHVDWYGAHATYDSNTASKAKATISIPPSQVFAQIYVGEDTSVVSPGVSGGSVVPFNGMVVTDSEVSSVATKNLVVVGGSCINSAAAKLVGGAFCGADWTEATGVGSGQFLIKGYATNSLTSKLALLVAGYEKQDTANAATYLTKQTVDTTKSYKGTSSTSAELVVDSASA